MRLAVAEAGQDEVRDTVVGVKLCMTCSHILREAIAQRRQGKIQLCAVCKKAVAAKFVDGRWVS